MKKYILWSIWAIFWVLLISVSFADVKTPIESANYLANNGIIENKSINISEYRLNATITRQEISKIITNIWWIIPEEICEWRFNDVKDGWGCKYIEWMLEENIIATNSLYRPNDNITKTEAMKLVLQIKNIEKIQETDSWQEDYMETAYENGIIEKKYYDYNTDATRAWIFVIAATTIGSDEDQEIIKEENTTKEVTIENETISFSNTPERSTFDRHAAFDINTWGQEIECSLNNGAFVKCDENIFLADIPEGDNTFSVRVKNSNNDIISYSWNIEDIFTSWTPDLLVSSQVPSKAEPRSWKGIIRINCDFSHSAYNDPIVYPGQEDAAHLHRFYGSEDLDHNTTMQSLISTWESTCQGNELNRSAYWVPSLLAPDYDQNTGEIKKDENWDDSWKAVPAVVGTNEEAHEVFYYSAWVDDLDSIQPIPAGLRMIAWDHMTKPWTEQSSSIVRWHCQSWESTDAWNPQWSATIPDCKAPDRVRMDIFFPSCWNWVDLDSDDHKSHMAYPIKNSQTWKVECSSSHPVPLVRPSYHYAFWVLPTVYNPQTKSSKWWRLASDHYTVTDQQAWGLSLHGDWFNAWHPSIMEAMLETCIQEWYDCHNWNLANGWRLSEVQEGIQNEPKVYNWGLSK